MIDFSQLALALPRYGGAFVTTGFLMVGTIAFASIFALIALVGYVRASERFKKPLLFILSSPLLFPPYIGAISYIELLKSQKLLGIFGNSVEMMLFQACMVMALFLYPYMLLFMVNAVRRIDPQYVVLMETYEPNVWSKIQKIYVPYLLTSVITGWMVIGLYVISDFGAVSILRVQTVTVELYYEIVTRFGFSTATVVSLGYVGVVLICLALSRALLSPTLPVYRKNAKPMRNFSFHSTDVIVYLGSVLLVFSGVVFPFGVVLSWIMDGILNPNELYAIWSNARSPLWEVMMNSMFIAFLIAVLTVGTALLVYSHQIMKHKNPYNSWYTFIAFLLYSLPGIVIGFSMLYVKYSFQLTGGVVWLLFMVGMYVRFIGIGSIALLPAVRGVSVQYAKIAETYVSGFLAQVRQVFVPILRGQLATSFHYVFFNAMRELTVPLLLVPIGFEVLSVRIWQTASEGIYGVAAPSILLLMAISTPSVILYILKES